MLLHLLASQSIFIVSVEVYTAIDERKKDADFITCGYSPVAILLFVIGVVVLWTYLYVVAYRRLDPGLPISGNCSLVISAACHPDLKFEEGDITAVPVQWGVNRQPEGDWAGHCSFSSGAVVMPENGALYRGKA